MQTVFHHDQWDIIGAIDSPMGLQCMEVWFSYQTEILVTFFFHFNYLISYLYGKIINSSFYMELWSFSKRNAHTMHSNAVIDT